MGILHPTERAFSWNRDDSVLSFDNRTPADVASSQVWLCSYVHTVVLLDSDFRIPILQLHSQNPFGCESVDTRYLKDDEH